MNIKKILFITLSNMGDVILTLPVLDLIKGTFPKSEITVMVGPRPKEVFEGNPKIDRLIIYDQDSKLRQKFKLFNELKRENFDVVIDLRNTLFGALLPARFRTSPFLIIPGHISHMRERNLYRLEKALKNIELSSKAQEKTFDPGPKDKEYIESLLRQTGVTASDKIIVLSCGAGGENRKWDAERFVKVCRQLSPDYKVILIGSKVNQQVSQYVCGNCENKIYDFTSLTDLKQLAYLLKRAQLLITCDTGTLQLGSYMDTPIIALFGPSNEKKYGPWSGKSIVIRKEIFCSRCRDAQCRFGTKECMKLIKVEDVLRAVKDILITKDHEPRTMNQNYFKRILIVRTDRIGDVLLSTPVIKAMRDNYPNAYIAMMVSPYAKDIVEDNPYLDAVIIYDKDGKHKSWGRSFKFARNLKKKKFDLALILHPTNRAHLVTFLAGIPERIGYNRKLGFLLTKKIEHTKQLGQKHELEYNLDLLKVLGIKVFDKTLFMPIRKDSEKWADDFLREKGISAADKLLAIHPGASCPSKVWPNERFAQVADSLSAKYGFKVLVISGPKDVALAQSVVKNMQKPAFNAGGRTSVSQLASLLKRCILLISNDSGPVHIASAVGIPVISIFGRSQKGLSPNRWGPVNKKGRVLHKEAGCIECLAHNCEKSFACIKAITIDDVLNMADSILR